MLHKTESFLNFYIQVIDQRKAFIVQVIFFSINRCLKKTKNLLVSIEVMDPRKAVAEEEIRCVFDDN